MKKSKKEREIMLTRQFAKRYMLLPRLYDFHKEVRDAILLRLENEGATTEQHTFYNWTKKTHPTPMREFVFRIAMDEIEKWEKKWPEIMAKIEEEEEALI